MSCKGVVIPVLTLFLLMTTGVQAQGGKSQSGGAANSGASNSETEVRDVYERWAKAFRAGDIKGIMALYAAGDTLVAYDIVPPLQYKGYDAYKKDYEDFLALYDGPIEVEFRDMRIVTADNVAFIHALERMTGTLKGGKKSDVWMRATSGLRKINGKWLIVHDHISVPVDMDSGKAALDLKP